MHFEILVEDRSGQKALDILIPKIIGAQDTFRVIGYKGSGRIPQNLKPTTNAAQRILLDRLPKLLRGYGQTFADYPANYPAAVIVVCDLDDNCLKTLRQELFAVLHACNPKQRAENPCRPSWPFVCFRGSRSFIVRTHGLKLNSHLDSGDRPARQLFSIMRT